MTSYWRYALNVVISLCILVFLFTRVPFEQIIEIVRQSRSDLFFLAFLAGVLSLLVSAWRWQILLRVLDYQYDLKMLAKLSFMAFFYNNFLPGGVAGEVARVAMLPEDKNSKIDRQTHLMRITASVVTDRVVGMIGIMLLAFMGFLFSRHLLTNSKIMFLFGLLTFGILSVFAVLFSRRIQLWVKTIFAYPLRILSPVQTIFRDVTESLFVYRDNYNVFMKVIPLSIFANFWVVVYFFLLARSIYIPIGFFRLLVFVPFIEFISTIPVSLSGVGIREAMTILLFSSEGFTAAQAIAVSLLTFLVLLMLGAVGGILFLFRKTLLRPS